MQSYQKDECVERSTETHWFPGKNCSSVYCNISDNLFIKAVIFTDSFSVLCF